MARWVRNFAVVLWAVYHYSGARWILDKFGLDKIGCRIGDDPPSGVVWLVGLYIALFGIANQAYVRALDVEQIIAASHARASSDEVNVYPHCSIADEYKEIVATIPQEPRISSVPSVFRSLFGRPITSMSKTNPRARELETFAFLTLASVRWSRELHGGGKYSVVGDHNKSPAAIDCGFNRSMQHLSSDYRAGGVFDEAKAEKIFHTNRDVSGLGSVGERRFTERDSP